MTQTNITNEKVSIYVLENSKCKSWDEFGAIEMEVNKYILIEWDNGLEIELDYEDVSQWMSDNMPMEGNTMDDFILHICTSDKMDLINGLLTEKLCK